MSRMLARTLTVLTKSSRFRTGARCTGKLAAKHLPTSSRDLRLRPPSVSNTCRRLQAAPLHAMTGPAGGAPVIKTQFLNGKGPDEAVVWTETPHPDWQPGQKQPNPWGSDATVRSLEPFHSSSNKKREVEWVLSYTVRRKQPRALCRI